MKDWRDDIRCEVARISDRDGQPTLSPDYRTWTVDLRIYGVDRIKPAPREQEEFEGWVAATFGVEVDADAWHEREEHDCPTCICESEGYVRLKDVKVTAPDRTDLHRAVGRIRYRQEVAS